MTLAFVEAYGQQLDTFFNTWSFNSQRGGLLLFIIHEKQNKRKQAY